MIRTVRVRNVGLGGPIEIATITKHEGFKWITRKHYYSPEFNREGGACL